MSFEILPFWSVFFISIFSLFVNVPLGYIREGYPKFSLLWFFWIHASIPLIIYFRILLDISNMFIAWTIFLAIIGQMIGSRLRKKRMTVQELESLKQISNLNLSGLFSVDNVSKIGIVLLNMGGPKTNGDVKDFQYRLFSDPILIRFPLSFIFQKFFAWILVHARLKISQKRYQLIGGGSPIYASTQKQVQAIKDELNKRGCPCEVVYCFNYSRPFPCEIIRSFKEKGIQYLLPLSLYPHYSKATTGSNLIYLQKQAKELYPELKILESPSYFLHEGYIQAFVDRILQELNAQEFLDDFYIIFSAHGLPLYFLTKGDPYPFQVAQTVVKVLAKLNRSDGWIISYQSAVGPLEWLKPSTEDVLQALGRRGIKKVLVVPISFVSDHIETLCELNIEYRALANQIGIEDFRMSKALECHPKFIEALADSVQQKIIVPTNINRRRTYAIF